MYDSYVYIESTHSVHKGIYLEPPVFDYKIIYFGYFFKAKSAVSHRFNSLNPLIESSHSVHKGILIFFFLIKL